MEYAEIRELAPGEYRALLYAEVNECRKSQAEQEARRMERLGHDVKRGDNDRH